MTQEAIDDPDLSWVRAVGEGDANAAARLVDCYMGRLHAFAWRMLGDREEAQDVVQDTFLRLWKHAGRWKPGAARFSTWLFQVAANGCRDRLRRRREHSDDALEQLVSDQPSVAQELQQDERSVQVREAIQRLPPRQREALSLCHFDGMGNIEAATVMAVSVDALESLLGRARRQLRTQLSALMEQE